MNDCLTIISGVFSAFTWTASTVAGSVIGASIGYAVAAHNERKKLINAARSALMIRLDVLDSDERVTDWDTHFGETVSFIRGDLFRALPYLREKDQIEIRDLWSNLKKALQGVEDPCSLFLIAVSHGLGFKVTTKKEAYVKTLENFSDRLNNASGILP